MVGGWSAIIPACMDGERRVGVIGAEARLAFVRAVMGLGTSGMMVCGMMGTAYREQVEASIVREMSRYGSIPADPEIVRELWMP
jgi:hypothetical protein